jgi:hypothetical protein
MPSEPVSPMTNIMQQHPYGARSSLHQHPADAESQQCQERKPEDDEMVTLDALEKLNSHFLQLIATDALGGAPATSSR